MQEILICTVLSVCVTIGYFKYVELTNKLNKLNSKVTKQHEKLKVLKQANKESNKDDDLITKLITVCAPIIIEYLKPKPKNQGFFVVDPKCEQDNEDDPIILKDKKTYEESNDSIKITDDKGKSTSFKLPNDSDLKEISGIISSVIGSFSKSISNDSNKPTSDTSDKVKPDASESSTLESLSKHT
jgi:hypothetical protein